MTKSLTRRERDILCHPKVCAHLKEFWDMYRQCAEIAVVLRPLDQVKPDQIEKLVKNQLDFAIAFSDLESFARTNGAKIGATFNGLYLLFVLLFMSINDYKKPPTGGPGGTKHCLKVKEQRALRCPPTTSSLPRLGSWLPLLGSLKI